MTVKKNNINEVVILNAKNKKLIKKIEVLNLNKKQIEFIEGFLVSEPNLGKKS